MLKLKTVVAILLAITISLSGANAQQTKKPLLTAEEVGSMLAFEDVNASAIEQYEGMLKRVDSIDTTETTEAGITGMLARLTILYRFSFDLEAEYFCGVREYKVEGTDFREKTEGEQISRTRMAAFYIDCSDNEKAHLFSNGKRSTISTKGLRGHELVLKAGPVGFKDFRRYAINDDGRFWKSSVDRIEKGGENVAGAKWINEKEYQFWSKTKKYSNGAETKNYLTYDTQLVMPVASFTMFRSEFVPDWKVTGSHNRTMKWIEINGVVLPKSGKNLTHEHFNLTGKRTDGYKCDIAREDEFHWYSVNKPIKKGSLFTLEQLDDVPFLQSLLDTSVFEDTKTNSDTETNPSASTDKKAD
jgi:hypothetical protein